MEQFESVIPVLPVDDILKTAEYYRDILGFKIDFIWGEPPSYASVSRGKSTINFRKITNGETEFRLRSHKGIDVYFCVAKLDTIIDEFKARNVKVLYEPAGQDYGMKEMNVEDCNGYTLCFGEESVEDDF